MGINDTEGILWSLIAKSQIPYNDYQNEIQYSKDITMHYMIWTKKL